MNNVDCLMSRGGGGESKLILDNEGIKVVYLNLNLQ